jgi:anti-sigma regulatory factor (Ser/Thr protein kinase)
MASFQHEALLYEGTDGFAAGTLPFIREGLEQGEPTMVAVSAERIGLLRGALGGAADDVSFVDMEALGRNPGRIIPAWHQFLRAQRQGERAIRGIGEPIWPGRGAEELAESQLHEALLNLAFADAEDFRLLCPYDRSALAEEVLREACGSHPSIVDRGRRRRSAAYRERARLLAPFRTPLPPPPAAADVLGYDRLALGDVRRAVAGRGTEAGLDPARAADLVLAVSEAATNSVQHGGGSGSLRMWTDAGALICELEDRGHVEDPLAGRDVPGHEASGGRGLYIAHRVCDLVQLRSDESGTVVRLHMRSARGDGELQA